MDRQAESEELLQGLVGDVTTAYQTERPMLLEQLQGQAEQPTALDLVQKVVQGTTFNYLTMLKETKTSEYQTLLKNYNCASDEDFANKVVQAKLLQPQGFDISAEAQALLAEAQNSPQSRIGE